MWKQLCLLALFVVPCLPRHAAAQPVVKIQGTVTYQHLGLGMVNVNPLTGQVPFPVDTKMELGNWYYSEWVPDKTFVVSAGTGSFSILTNAEPTDAFRIRVYIQTLKDAGAGTPRVNVGGWESGDHWFETTDFTTARAAPGPPPTLTVNIHVGSTVDADGLILNGYDKRAPLLSCQPLGEEAYARFAVALVVVDEAYRLVEASGKLPWLGASPHGDYSNGQRIWSPTSPFFSRTRGIAWPGSFRIHLRYPDGLTLTDAAHEFGHVVHYHTTDVGLGDLFWEVLGHGYNEETDTHIAYCEGWAEYFEAMFRATSPLSAAHLYEVENPPAALPPRGAYWHYWKGKDNDGTNNSGEIVEGAVAQTFWRFAPSTGGFAASIEDVWAAVREGATAGSRNSRKTFKEFYDAVMVLQWGSPKQQVFRNICDVHGLVFSRMKLTEFEPVADSGNWTPAADNVWLSADSRLKAAPMTAEDLKVSAVVNAQLIGFQIHAPGSATPYAWSSVPYTDLTGPTWGQAGNTFTDVAEGAALSYRAVLDAAAAGLDNRYYMVRAAVKPPGLGAADEFVGPVLETITGSPAEASGKGTAQWWRELGINYVVKIDKVKPKVETSGRKPAANP